MKVKFERNYSKKKLFISGLDSKTLNEKYYIIDFAKSFITKLEIDTTEYRAKLLDYLKENLSIEDIPYGFTDHSSLISYYLHPHSFIQHPDTNNIFIFYKQAPYFRKINGNLNENQILPKSNEIDFNKIFSSTNSFSSDSKSIFLTYNSGQDRLNKYKNVIDTIPLHLATYSLESDTLTKKETIDNFLIDSLHQLALSKNNIQIGLDMNLSVDVDRSFLDRENLSLEIEKPSILEKYLSYDFPRSKFFINDLSNNYKQFILPNTACVAHVDFDWNNPDIFFVSCHNISKIFNNVVCHGQGSIEKYQYSEGRVKYLDSLSDERFFRITSHKTFSRNGHSYIASVAYPNYLYIIDGQELTVLHRIELFKSNHPGKSFICAKNSVAPLYLVLSEDNKYIFLTGNSKMFVVDLQSMERIETFDFCEEGTFIASAHIGLII